MEDVKTGKTIDCRIHFFFFSIDECRYKCNRHGMFKNYQENAYQKFEELRHRLLLQFRFFYIDLKVL